MKLLINIMKKSVKKFFGNEELYGIRTFFILARLCPGSHVNFFYEDLTNNEFIGEIVDISSGLLKNEINKFIDLYVYSKKIYNILNRFVYKWKIRNTKKYEMEFDLYFNPLINFPDNQLVLLIENKTIYKFRLTDLINIWKESLFYCNGLFPEPKKVKNPYTNLYFSKHNLYNIYIAITNTSFQVPIIIQLFFYSSFNLRLFISNNYPYLKENCIEQFAVDGISFEKYDHIVNMFYNYRKDISYCYLPHREDINYEHMCSYIDKLSRALTHYLLASYSCNTWNKDNNSKLCLIKIKKFIDKNPNEVMYPTTPSTESLTELRRRTNTLRRRVNRRNAMTTIEMPRLRHEINSPPPLPPPTISTTNPHFDETRESLNNLINDIDLAVINSNAVSPFIPSYQIPRTPIRQNY